MKQTEEYKQVNLESADCLGNSHAVELNRYAKNGWKLVKVLSTKGHNNLKATYLLSRPVIESEE